MGRLDLVSVYISYIRPVMEYGAPVWHSGLSNSLSNKIEKVQRRAVRIILGASFTSYSTACAQLEVNVALGKNATQSSTNGSLGAEKAVDGDDTECAETNIEHQPWWKVDLAGFYRVSRITFLSRDVRVDLVMSGVRSAVGDITPPSLADEDVVNLVPVPAPASGDIHV
ncbi:hypothetical protein Bbelb_159480 [Branchiostoma belcheri]|nr:hypothetical protein Bbelb_159480 [Branchiostoma belcheri]